MNSTVCLCRLPDFDIRLGHSHFLSSFVSQLLQHHCHFFQLQLPQPTSPTATHQSPESTATSACFPILPRTPTYPHTDLPLLDLPRLDLPRLDLPLLDPPRLHSQHIDLPRVIFHSHKLQYVYLHFLPLLLLPRHSKLSEFTLLSRLHCHVITQGTRSLCFNLHCHIISYSSSLFYSAFPLPCYFLEFNFASISLLHCHVIPSCASFFYFGIPTAMSFPQPQFPSLWHLHCHIICGSSVLCYIISIAKSFQAVRVPCIH